MRAGFLKQSNNRNRDIRFPQLAKEPILTSRLRPNAENRVIAKIIDTALIEVVLIAAAFVWEPSVFFLALLLWAFIEGFGRGQSPGKWLLGLHTIEVRRGAKPSIYASLVRNFPFVLLSWGVGRSGWIAAICLVPAAFCIFVEAYFVFNVRSGIRVGDIIGSTRVADYKDEHTKFIEQFLREEEAI